MDAPADRVVIMHYHWTLKTTSAKHNSEKVTERVVFRQLALYFYKNLTHSLCDTNFAINELELQALFQELVVGITGNVSDFW